MRGQVPVSVAIGHKSALVAAGLAVTLSRMPECEVQLSPISGFNPESDNDDAQLVFGDSALLKRLRDQYGQPGKACPLARAKFVWVTTDDESEAHAAKVAGEIDEHLPIDCPEQELFQVVRRLVGRDASDDWHSPSPSVRPIRPRALGGLAPGTLRRVREYIDEHLIDNLQTEVLADIAKLSLGHFNRAFKQSTGDSPHHYIIRQRVAMANELLVQTSRTLNDIALEAGFADQSHFCRTYVAVTGETPGACRRRHR
jgi:AraC-like DNA-binding protein